MQQLQKVVGVRNAAAFPARRPKTQHSSNELPIIRLRPCVPPAISPQAYRPSKVVCAFEVLEHVQSVDGFLTSLEQLVKPGGRVYLSTPNGCFGAGHNPNHLRATK